MTNISEMENIEKWFAELKKNKTELESCIDSDCRYRLLNGQYELIRKISECENEKIEKYMSMSDFYSYKTEIEMELMGLQGPNDSSISGGAEDTVKETPVETVEPENIQSEQEPENDIEFDVENEESIEQTESKEDTQSQNNTPLFASGGGASGGGSENKEAVELNDDKPKSNSENTEKTPQERYDELAHDYLDLNSKLASCDKTSKDYINLVKESIKSSEGIIELLSNNKDNIPNADNLLQKFSKDIIEKYTNKYSALMDTLSKEKLDDKTQRLLDTVIPNTDVKAAFINVAKQYVAIDDGITFNKAVRNGLEKCYKKGYARHISISFEEFESECVNKGLKFCISDVYVGITAMMQDVFEYIAQLRNKLANTEDVNKDISKFTDILGKPSVDAETVIRENTVAEVNSWIKQSEDLYEEYSKTSDREKLISIISNAIDVERKIIDITIYCLGMIKPEDKKSFEEFYKKATERLHFYQEKKDEIETIELNEELLGAVVDSGKYTIDDIKLLIKKIKKIDEENVRDYCGRTALMSFVLFYKTAKTKEKEELIDEFINKGANINAKEKDGSTLLMSVVANKASKQEIESLIAKNANVNETDNRGRTPLMFAIKYKAPKEVIKLLIDNHAKLNAKNSDGDTPLMVAIKNKASEEVIELLKIELLKKKGWYNKIIDLPSNIIDRLTKSSANPDSVVTYSKERVTLDNTDFEEKEYDFRQVKELSLNTLNVSKAKKIKFNKNADEIYIVNVKGLKGSYTLDGVKHTCVAQQDLSKVKLKVNSKAETIEFKNITNMTGKYNLKGVQNIVFENVDLTNVDIKFNPKAKNITLIGVTGLHGKHNFNDVKNLKIERVDESKAEIIRPNSQQATKSSIFDFAKIKTKAKDAWNNFKSDNKNKIRLELFKNLLKTAGGAALTTTAISTVMKVAALTTGGSGLAIASAAVPVIVSLVKMGYAVKNTRVGITEGTIKPGLTMVASVLSAYEFNGIASILGGLAVTAGGVSGFFKARKIYEGKGLGKTESTIWAVLTLCVASCAGISAGQKLGELLGGELNGLFNSDGAKDVQTDVSESTEQKNAEPAKSEQTVQEETKPVEQPAKPENTESAKPAEPKPVEPVKPKKSQVPAQKVVVGSEQQAKIDNAERITNKWYVNDKTELANRIDLIKQANKAYGTDLNPHRAVLLNADAGAKTCDNTQFADGGRSGGIHTIFTKLWAKANNVDYGDVTTVKHMYDDGQISKNELEAALRLDKFVSAKNKIGSVFGFNNKTYSR